jgi:effector-binding domain-containing protein
MDDVLPTVQALARWIDGNGYRCAGYAREVTLECETRADQPYVAIRARVNWTAVGEMGPRLGEVYAWPGARGLAPTGEPFFRYNVIDMTGELEVDAGVPVATAVDGDAPIVSGVLPAGRYATLTHVGHPSELVRVTKALLDWAAEQGLTWDMTPSEGGERWGSRLEVYLTDPGQEPDMGPWVTQLAFRFADQ